MPFTHQIVGKKFHLFPSGNRLGCGSALFRSAILAIISPLFKNDSSLGKIAILNLELNVSPSLPMKNPVVKINLSQPAQTLVLAPITTGKGRKKNKIDGNDKNFQSTSP